jgi:DNA invertase Pin-like site-specific DNA recombinase
MATGKFISYLRVSTAKQGQSGLGLEAQRTAVENYLNGGQWKVITEFTEVESGKHSNRPQLAKALAACRVHKAKLVVAKLDRLSRNAAFLMTLRDSGVEFIAADMPEANTLTIGILAVVAQAEREAISTRTKAALAAAKARGKKLGGDRGNLPAVAAKGTQASIAARQAKAAQRARDLEPTINELRAGGCRTLSALAAGLNGRNIPTPRGNGVWQVGQVSVLLERIAT